MRKTFHQQLKDLQKDIVEMGSKSCEMIEESLQALIKRDKKLAEKVINDDDIVDKMELNIESKCIELIATQQPMAKDLRLITTVLKIISDVERIADYTVDIAKKAKKLAPYEPLKPYVDVPKMAKLTQDMLKKSIKSFNELDIKLAKKIGKMDKEVDRLYNITFDELIDYMLKDKENVVRATHLLLVARFYERIGDHITNIVERVVYLKTGKLVELNY